MPWKTEATDEFAVWYRSLSERERTRLDRTLRALASAGPALGRPHVDTVVGSRHPNMEELRTGTLRLFFVFDPCRTAVLLIGADKRGRKRFYGRMIVLADTLYAAYLDAMRRENSSR